ncbi:hypothetical protein PG991_015680 [Apiospora marii]|uniref:ubiquitinyl hydrolase 1 n=1 Tax=Apiospora marii TaxID=335849 RepID=A0ABR1R383_9PEZI
MDLLLTLSLRLFELGQDAGSADAARLVEEIRTVTLGWISELQLESRKLTDSSSAKVISNDIFRASLVCRRTFVILAKATIPLTRSELRGYVKASLALQMNIIGDPSKLPLVPKAMFVRDAKIAALIRRKLHDSILLTPQGLEEAICEVWSLPPWVHQYFLPWKDSADVSNGKETSSWVVTTATSKYGPYDRKQVIHYNFIEGCLLIDGKAFGKLPLEIRNSEDVKLLFENENLQTLPSSVSGMTHQLLNNPKGHQIHFGLRGERAVILDRTRDGMFQFIPSRVFRGADSYDLPSSLLDGCIHWLNIDKGVLEIRQAQKRWITRSNDWRIDLKSRRARRSQVYLVNPHGPLASKIVRIFRGFEDPQRLTIFQPEKGRLSVELKHLDLSFFVNNNNLLESRELGLEIDQNQGVETLPHLHALTSFVIPDRLTGRTGTEEAFAILGSGQCQPWQPLDSQSISLLQGLAELCPTREYYPKDKKNLQGVVWKSSLSPNAQHDCFYDAVCSILSGSKQLGEFSLQDPHNFGFLPKRETHLRRRGEVQATRYARANDVTKCLEKGRDDIYEPRDRVVSSRAVNAHKIASICWGSQIRIDVSPIKPIMTVWGLIGGFDQVESDNSATLESLVEDHVSQNWGSHVQFCKRTGQSERFKTIFRLSVLAFSEKPDMDIIKTFAAIGCIDELRKIPTPVGSSFNIGKNEIQPSKDELVQLLSSAYPQFVENPRLRMGQRARRRKEHEDRQELQCQEIARNMLAQWPAQSPSPYLFHTSEINLDSSFDSVKATWQRAYQNLEMSRYVDAVQATLGYFRGERVHSKPMRWTNRDLVRPWKQSHPVVPGLLELLANSGPGITHVEDLGTPLHGGVSSGETAEMQELSMIIRRFIQNSNDPARKTYGSDLSRSLEAYKDKPDLIHRTPNLMPKDPAEIETVVQDTSVRVKAILQTIRQSCAESDGRFEWLRLTTLWPCMSPVTVLEQLRSTTIDALSHSMREAIVGFGISITVLQKHNRMLDAAARQRPDKLMEEYSNVGHQNWKPSEVLEWLLLEIDGDILIRQEQVDVANAIVAEGSSSNHVLQLNMGRGKTSVILPMAAIVLANKTRLARLIIPKALLLQTAQILQSRIGVLVNRPIMHIPFSRRTPTSSKMITSYEELHRKLMLSRGVMVTTPETVLSFKLSGLQQLRDGNSTAASKMIGLQDWMTRSCRDVLDESDFTLAVKTQLIYPSGAQESLDGHPHRWLVAQNILAIVEEHLADIKRMHPKGITIIKRGNAYPMSHFLNAQAEACLTGLLIQDVAEGKLLNLRYSSPAGPESYSDVADALTSTDFNTNRIKKLSRRFTEPEVAFKCLHLLRGLLNSNILITCLKKRWNVQYGLHESRDPIAVPFEAKGVPHPQAEFGHPDAAIVLTCLSYYYTGLSLAQMMQGLRMVLDSDDPVAEFDRWTGGCHEIPETLQNVKSINLEDPKQMRELWQRASGWDLPQFSPDDHGQVNKTTGFSGTNDNKSMLPFNIHQKDLPGLHHTNAEVLTYLLRPGNRSYVPAMHTHTNEPWSEQQLLEEIHRKGIRILIDAGAYILDMDNGTVVEQWLRIDTQAKAAVYFKNDNRAWVKYRGSRKLEAPLLATPFADNLQDCVVYLDQAHTRGTDMKFPPSAKGAVTLALFQTKDHTVQAAMRLRQLKTTQSIMFVAPPEVHLSIADVCKKRNWHTVDSADVIYWLLEQTCSTNEQLQGLFFAQGQDYCRRTNAAHINADFLRNANQKTEYLKVLEQPERQTLQRMYGTRPSVGAQSATRSGEAASEMSSKKLEDFSKLLLAKCTSANADSDLEVLGEVEQEREVEFQVEEIRDVRKPVKHEALVFPGLHKQLHGFVETGELGPRHPFRHVVTVAGDTDIGAKHIAARPSTNLFASSEFERTINLKQGRRNDSFMRPVEWILWSRLSETGVVIIREEAERLVDLLRGKVHPRVYLVTYAAPVTKAMETLGQMTFYTIPSLPAGYNFPTWLPLEVGIFAGRLYLDFESWLTIDKQLRDDSTENDGKHKAGKLVAENPRGFLLDWLSFRRRGQDVLYTPMGYLCQGRQLTKDHAFFSEANVESSPRASPIDSEVSASDVDDSEDTDDASSEEEFDDN